MVSKKTIKKLMDKYKEAWETCDPDIIVSIFTEDGTYSERAFEKPFVGHKSIRKYWEDKVVGEQEDVSFKVTNTYIDGNTAIVEFSTEFRDKVKKCWTKLKSIAVFNVKNGKMQNWREYWHSKHSETPW